MYNVIEFGISMKLLRLMKMCVNETYSRVRVVKHISMFPIRNGLKQRCFIAIAFQLRFRVRH